jgi:hypothetical protein
LIFSKTREQHVIDLRNILQKLRENSLKASLNKCEFFCSKVTFLGFDITDTGLKMNEHKLQTIADWPFPSNLKELQCFLGFINFYRRFIPWFSQVAGALTNLTKNDMQEDSCLNSKVARNSFDNLKQLFVNEPLLIHFSFDKDRSVHVDSSGYAIVAVLSQPNANGIFQPVSYFSRKLSDRERSWPIFNLELVAIVLAFEEWRAWLMGTKNPVWVFSDHSNLLYFKTAKHLSPKQARWANYLDNFNMLIFHIAGSRNPADAPSRREDYCDGNLVRQDADSITRNMVACDQVKSVSIKSKIHDLHFQRPSPALLSYFEKSYTDLEKKT